MKYLNAVIVLLTILVLLIVYTYPVDQSNPAAGYNSFYGGAGIYEYNIDVVSLYTFKGIRL